VTQPFSHVDMRSSTDKVGARWATNDPHSASAAGVPLHSRLRTQQVPRLHVHGITLAFYYRCPQPGRGR